MQRGRGRMRSRRTGVGRAGGCCAHSLVGLFIESIDADARVATAFCFFVRVFFLLLLSFLPCLSYFCRRAASFSFRFFLPSSPLAAPLRTCFCRPVCHPCHPSLVVSPRHSIYHPPPSAGAIPLGTQAAESEPVLEQVALPPLPDQPPTPWTELSEKQLRSALVGACKRCVGGWSHAREGGGGGWRGACTGWKGAMTAVGVC